MQQAFVVQLVEAGDVISGQLEGAVEEVDTGNYRRFHSGDELIGFLQERRAALRARPDSERNSRT